MDNTFGDEASPEKEDAVREALGVDKRFTVNIAITTIGSMYLEPIVVEAANEDDAKAKAIELALSGEVDIDGDVPGEARHDYDYSDSNTWIIEVSDIVTTKNRATKAGIISAHFERYIAALKK